MKVTNGEVGNLKNYRMTFEDIKTEENETEQVLLDNNI